MAATEHGNDANPADTYARLAHADSTDSFKLQEHMVAARVDSVSLAHQRLSNKVNDSIHINRKRLGQHSEAGEQDADVASDTHARLSPAYESPQQGAAESETPKSPPKPSGTLELAGEYLHTVPYAVPHVMALHPRSVRY